MSQFMKKGTFHTVWFDFCLTALQHILGHFGCNQLPNHTVPGQASKAVYQYLVHILSPVTGNCSFWISGRGRMAVTYHTGKQWRLR